MISYQLLNNKLLISYINDKGKIAHYSHVIPDDEMFTWEKSRTKTGYRNHLGGYARKNYNKKPNRFRIWEIIYGFDDEIRNTISNDNEPDTWFMDIETEVIDGFPDVDNPREKVLTNSFCNNNIVVSTGIKDLSAMDKEWIQQEINRHLAPINKKYNFKFKHYPSEQLMLKELFSVFVPSMPMIVGWNFLKFDWAYLVARATRLGLNKFVLKSSPTGVMEDYYIKDKYNRNHKQKIRLPLHRIVLDDLTLWEKYDYSMKIKSSAKLDNVAKEVLGIKKVEYNDTFMGMYNKDYKRYVFYNAIDTILNKEIHDKLGYFNSLNKLSMLTHTPMNQALFVSHCLESRFVESYLARGRHMVSNSNNDTDTYSGAFVKEPNPGIFDNVLISDFESLYPNLTMKFNISTDTYMGVKSSDSTYICRFTNEEKKLQLGEKHIVTEEGTVFASDKIGVAPEIINRLINERLYSKKTANEIDAEKNYLENLLKSM